MKRLVGSALVMVMIVATAATAWAGYSPSTWWCDGGYYYGNRSQQRACRNLDGHYNPST